ncbi:hypothetical protein VD0004_g6843 [Verticillium dahliae]|uniref:Uncharacterized protein n=1 Tax=Verticillium dahliae TaxID=27337 RepID=A0A444S2E2_VERDA|nr:hypothetical protein VD0004_g6843 [Verticillium dahliae]PNH63465.1 hypothetical protein VD0001_g9126 [Verticillium dahliae]RXG47479.1 hypothetical protein VDGE_08681 [Verticillium dahliae]
MKAAASIILAASALATAQVTYNETTGVFTCAEPNVAYCAGDSLGTDIIIRCNGASIGQPGRCTNNLAGQPPIGVNPALCFQTSKTSGDAACEKNCIVYPEDGSKPFTLPADQCKQSGSGSNSTTTTTAPIVPSTTSDCASTSVYHHSNSTRLYPPVPYPTNTKHFPPHPRPTNGTNPSYLPTPPNDTPYPTSVHNNATNVPVRPTGTSTNTPPDSVPTAGAARNGIGALALALVAAVYFL